MRFVRYNSTGGQCVRVMGRVCIHVLVVGDKIIKGIVKRGFDQPKDGW